MSRIVPDPLLGELSPATMRTYRALKSIPGDELTVWVSLPFPNASPRPEFLVALGRAAFLLAASDLSQSAAENFIGGSLFESSERALAADDWRKLGDFVNLAQSRLRESRENAASIVGILLFPNVDHGALAQALGANPREGLYFLGRDHMAPDELAKCLHKLAVADFLPEELATLRALFTPESVVPRHFTPRGRIERNTNAKLTPLLLDIDQEAWAKQRLRLSSDGMRVADMPASETSDPGGATLVTGVAGSGKSVVLLFRACTQARLEPGSRSLVLTHNKALGKELVDRFREIGNPGNVQWHTFSSWCHRQLSAAGRVPKPIAYGERDRIIEDTARGIWPMSPPRWTRFLSDEYDWIQDHGLVTLDGYLAADRTGRRLGLQADRRAQVFSAYERYRVELDRRNREDWSGMALRLWRKVERREVRLPGYDYIYVDEAQFFAPVWFHTLRAALSPSGRIFMAADPTQGFLKRRQSWTASGFDVRGRSTRLRRSYRNARPILEFAAAFYRSRLDDEDLGDLNLPEEEELASAPPGERAQFISVTSRQDELNRVINEIRAFLGGGGNPAAILVLTALGRSTAEIANRLRHALGSEMICDARLTDGTGKIRICALDGATGLEAAIVFIVGTAEMLEAENDLQLPLDQRAEMIRDNTRRLYMGFTRAGMRLVITWHGSLPAWSSTARCQQESRDV